MNTVNFVTEVQRLSRLLCEAEQRKNVAEKEYDQTHEELTNLVTGKNRTLREKCSHRQREVIQLLCRNKSNKEIGTELGISERTVKFHVSELLAKFGFHNRIQLIQRFTIQPCA